MTSLHDSDMYIENKHFRDQDSLELNRRNCQGNTNNEHYEYTYQTAKWRRLISAEPRQIGHSIVDGFKHLRQTRAHAILRETIIISNDNKGQT